MARAAIGSGHSPSKGRSSDPEWASPQAPDKIQKANPNVKPAVTQRTPEAMRRVAGEPSAAT